VTKEEWIDWLIQTDRAFNAPGWKFHPLEPAINIINTLKTVKEIRRVFRIGTIMETAEVFNQYNSTSIRKPGRYSLNIKISNGLIGFCNELISGYDRNLDIHDTWRHVIHTKEAAEEWIRCQLTGEEYLMPFQRKKKA